MTDARLLDVHPDRAQARQPPPALYRPGPLQQALVERVLARGWHVTSGQRLAASTAQATTLLPGCLDEPLLEVTDADGRGAAFANACSHRGSRLLSPDQPPHPRRQLVCRYHGRSFDLAGRCLARPGFEGSPQPTDDLVVRPSGQLGPLRLASIDPLVDLDPWLAPARALLPPDLLDLDAPDRSQVFEVDAHWALYVDNYLEGLHIPFVHRGLAQALDLPAYRVELLPWGALQLGAAAAHEPRLLLPDGRDPAAAWLWLFPCTMLNLYPWGLSLNVVQPVSAAHTRIAYHLYVLDPTVRERGAGAELERVEAEDRAAVEAVAAGLSARGFRGGGYAPAEAAVHHFHRLLALALDTPPGQRAAAPV